MVNGEILDKWKFKILKPNRKGKIKRWKENIHPSWNIKRIKKLLSP